MRRLRRIKILATLGPASSDSAMIRKLFEAGADVFRINMSHTPHDKMRELVKTIRNVEAGRHYPTKRTQRRLCAVAVLNLRPAQLPTELGKESHEFL
mgnify:CR=1 FL=1